MVDFNSGYLPPGVYVESQSTGSVAVVGVGETVICLVGDGVGHQTNTENLLFSGVDSFALTKKFIDLSSIVATAQLATGKKTFAPDAVSPSVPHDYAVSTDSGTNMTTFTRTTTGTLPSDRAVTVTYQYADDEYYGLNKFTDYPTLSQVYGAPLDPVDGSVQSPITLAAQFAFRNGANLVYAVACDPRGVTPPSRAEQFGTAYAKLLPNHEINLLVPLLVDAVDTPSATTFIGDVAVFLDTAAGEGCPMMAVCGVAKTYTTTDPDTLSTSVANRRVVLAWPQALNFFNSTLNSTVAVDGVYLAAACAGTLANQSVNRGLTRSQIRGFTGISASLLSGMTLSKRNTWSSKGVAVAELNRSNQLVMRHGVTTDVSDIGNREISIVRCQDVLLETMQLSLDGADLIGDPITVNTPLMVSSLISGALETALTDNVIQNYTDLIVTQQKLPTGDPTVIQVTFSYQPTYPLNYITVTFTLDLTTNVLVSATTDNSAA